MHITIAQRLRPFCHLPGTACPIPFTEWQVQAFPELLILKNLVTHEKREYLLGWKGPVWDFTVELDLEKGHVRIFGHTAEGYRSFVIAAVEKGISLNGEVIPVQGLFERKEVERLSLGSHRQLDWELVKRRRDLTEILPVWFRLGQMVPKISGPKAGAASLLEPAAKLAIVDQFLKAFYTGFSGMLSPRLADDDLQGIIPPLQPSTASPLMMLSEGSLLIRSLFFAQEGEIFSFLPCLPPQFHAGRFVDLVTQQGDKMEIEWSKKLLHRVIIWPGACRSIQLVLQKPLQSMRLRHSLREKGKKVNVSEPLPLEKGRPILLDRFE